MALNEYDKYRKIPFSTETRYTDFYTYVNLTNLALQCETCKEDIIKCRTIGVLQSIHGKFWLADMDKAGVLSETRVRVSLAYLKFAPPSTIRPYPVQVFGTAQWKKEPVIFIKIMQVLSIPMAIRIRDIMNTITDTHLATVHQDPTSG